MLMISFTQLAVNWLSYRGSDAGIRREVSFLFREADLTSNSCKHMLESLFQLT